MTCASDASSTSSGPGVAADVPWKKSSFSINGGCVETAPLQDGTVGIRDSKDPAAGMLVFTRHEIHCFLQGVRNGEFDHLAADGELPG